MKFNLVQVNIGRIKAPLVSREMAGFVARLDEALAQATDWSSFEPCPSM